MCQALSSTYSEKMLNSAEFLIGPDSGKANFDDIMVQLSHLIAAVQVFEKKAAATHVALGVVHN